MISFAILISLLLDHFLKLLREIRHWPFLASEVLVRYLRTMRYCSEISELYVQMEKSDHYKTICEFYTCSFIKLLPRQSVLGLGFGFCFSSFSHKSPSGI